MAFMRKDEKDLELTKNHFQECERITKSLPLKTHRGSMKEKIKFHIFQCRARNELKVANQPFTLGHLSTFQTTLSSRQMEVSGEK